MINVIELSLFSSRIQAICDEMGAILRQTAFSPNIKDRLDFSCAVFDDEGNLCAQAAHIPVHLGSMAYTMRSIIKSMDWDEEDAVIFNDPYLGGTHLPDVTIVSPVFLNKKRYAFVANRAHHADIGSETPGSMPVSRSIEEEGMIIPPTFLERKSSPISSSYKALLKNVSNPDMTTADLNAQLSANKNGQHRLSQLINRVGNHQFPKALKQLNHYAQSLASSCIQSIPDGCYEFEELMDDDGLGNRDIPLRLKLVKEGLSLLFDFSETANQVDGNINCPVSVTAAAVFYCLRCLMPDYTPNCAGIMRDITIKTKKGSLVDACYPAAVAAGNVETSTRLVDLILGALAQALPGQIPAASHGSMNNIAMGSNDWDYYETLGGGMGASSLGAGLDAVQTHMTNTLNTPIEVLEKYYPIRIKKYAIRDNSGGKGINAGGNGLIREYEFLQDTSVTLLTERRANPPWGLAGGESGQCGKNLVNAQPVNAKIALTLSKGDRLRIETAGGGGWGKNGT